jgi:hypothetical protein
MSSRKIFAALVSPVIVPFAVSAAAAPADAALEQEFGAKVRPFVQTYCTDCHGGEKPEAELDLARFDRVALVVQEFPHWALVLEKLAAGEMPSEKAKKFPTDAEREAVIAWIKALRASEAQRNAGDPGVVLARRLSNAEYNYTIRDLTGVDLQPTREFPVDPANPAGFDNSGESLAMSPALLTKYLQAARDVANHVVLKPAGIAFAPYPMLVETDRDKYCVSRIVDFYRRQPTDYADYFVAAWRFKHRSALGRADATLAEAAREAEVSAKYLALVWASLETAKEEVGPGAKLQAMWRALPAPAGAQASAPRAECEKMRDWIVQLRARLEPRFPNITGVRGLAPTSQPSLMWKNRQYATHRRDFDRAALQIEGNATPEATARQKPKATVAAADAVDEEALPVEAPRREGVDPDLFVPAAERARYEAAFARFCAVFPDAFYVQERGRNYLDKTKDKGRLLSAGFHNVMGYFRDDQPLYELILDAAGQGELDALWRELDFVALAAHRTYVQFYFNESGEARDPSKRTEEKDVTKEPMVQAMAASYLARVKASNHPEATRAVEEHFAAVNATLRWVEQAKIAAEPLHLAAVLEFAARAYRRPLSAAEEAELRAFYASLRRDAGLAHEDAIRDLLVSVLMAPDFCYRIDLAPEGRGVQALSDFALASRLSYFLWASAPDAELLASATAGKLREPATLAAQARRMLKDPRARALATDFGGSGLDFRRFEEHNAVDRERFPSFTPELRAAMAEEPVRFLGELIAADRSILDCLYAKHTFVNAALARHYGMPEPRAGAGEWVRVEDADRYGRGGALPMAAFLTKNAPGLRTSPVKRGYWVVKKVLGEYIPPPPAVVPELPRDEAKTDLPLRDMLARHRQDKSCASCHARFDSLGLVFEGYGPIGERREKDLAGRAIDAHATFPGGTAGEGFAGLKNYIREKRQDDFVTGFCRQLLAYALGRSLMLSDEPLIDEMRTRLARDGYRFTSAIEAIVTSRQFTTKRGRDEVAANAQ